MKKKWQPYLKVRPATSQDVANTESALSVQFPGSFVDFMVTNQGMSSEDMRVVDERSREIGIGYLFFFSEASGGQRNIKDLCLMFRKRGYPGYLVPFASAGGQPHLALDYRSAKSSPAVVYVYPDGDAENTGYWSTSLVTPDFESFLERIS